MWLEFTNKIMDISLANHTAENAKHGILLTWIHIHKKDNRSNR